MLKIFKLIFVLAFALNVGGLLIAGTAQAALLPKVKDPIDFKPQVSIPGSTFSNTGMVSGGTYDPETKNTTSDLLAKYIQAFYNYGVAVVGILAAIVLMGGGVLWLTSAGNDSKITQAKELIAGSIIGVVILFGSWIILNTINPDLLELKVVSLTGIDKKVFKGTTCCDPDGGGRNFDTIVKDGKKYFNSGTEKGKEFPGCVSATGLATTIECPDENYSCEKTGDTGLEYSYKCVKNDDICCACSGSFGGASTYLRTSCQNHVKSKSDCEYFCSTWKSDSNTHFYPGEYNCDSSILSKSWCRKS